MTKNVEKKYPKISAIEVWIGEATNEMRKILAHSAGTSTSMFRQWAAGRRGLSADLACRLAEASLTLFETTPNAPAPLMRGELCVACRKCPHFIADMEDAGVEDLIEIGSDTARYTRGADKPIVKPKSHVESDLI